MHKCEQSPTGTHEWICPGPAIVPANGGISILLPLYCKYCLDTKTLFADKPEETIKQQLRNNNQQMPLPFKKQ